MTEKNNNPLPPSVLLPYKGGHIVNYGGYFFELCPNHPKANPFGFVPQHRLIVERDLNRYLTSKEQVHHKDGCKTNNSIDNLFVCSRSEHMKIHAQEKLALKRDPLTMESVKKALSEGGLKHAAKVLSCHTETIRNLYPDLVRPYKRKSPTKIDNPEIIQLILSYAIDPHKSLRDTSLETGVSYRTIGRICEKNGIKWISPYRGKGEVHKQYRRKKSIQN